MWYNENKEIIIFYYFVVFILLNLNDDFNYTLIIRNKSMFNKNILWQIYFEKL